MTLEYDDLADVMEVSFSEPTSKCTYVESISGAILRVEISTGRIVGARILGYSRRSIQSGVIDIPEMKDARFTAEWCDAHSRSSAHK